MAKVGVRRVTKRQDQKCGFCDGPDGEQYIYPLPEEYRNDLFEGMKACSKCFPKIRQMQYDEGILLPVQHVELDLSWQEEEDD